MMKMIPLFEIAWPNLSNSIIELAKASGGAEHDFSAPPANISDRCAVDNLHIGTYALQSVGGNNLIGDVVSQKRIGLEHRKIDGCYHDGIEIDDSRNIPEKPLTEHFIKLK